MAGVRFETCFHKDGQQTLKPFGNAGDFGSPDKEDVAVPLDLVQLGGNRGTKRIIEDEDLSMVEEGNVTPGKGFGRRKRRKRKQSAITQQDKNALMQLNELKPGLEFVTSSQQGPPHAPTFVVTVEVEGQVFGGMGASKQKAKLSAAEKVIQSIPMMVADPSVAPDSVNTFQSFDPTTQQGISDEDKSKQPVMLLNEISEDKLDYQFEEDPSQQEPFICTVAVQGKEFTGTGISKKKAKVVAACKVLGDIYDISDLTSESMNTSQILDPTAEQQQQQAQRKGGITKEDRSKQPVMLLNEISEGKVDYQFEEDHSQQEPFICTVAVQEKEFTGTGISKKKAKVVVACKVLEDIYDISTDYTGPFSSGSNIHVHGHPPPETQLPQVVADAIAQMTLVKFKELSSALGEPGFRRKVLAGIVMTTRRENEELQYQMISIGSGTKFIGGEYISDKGYAINDCHGEIIARRGLRRFLFAQLEAYMRGEIHASVLENKESGLLGLKSGIEFHLYISTSPCGDARVFSPHEDEAGVVDKHAARKKRGILRVKLENGEGTIPVANYNTSVQTWDGVIASEKLRTMSCSDKISKWNVLGIQGALLSNFMEPIYLSSITLGSLYRYDHMSRAMYSRLGSIPNLPQLYQQHQPLMNSISFPEPRLPGKAPKNSVNWTTGDDSLENVCTLTGKLMETNQPSRLCKQAMFARFCILWDKINPNVKPPIAYQDAKVASQDYQLAKELMVNAFGVNGLGAWLKKPVEQDWFNIIGSL